MRYLHFVWTNGAKFALELPQGSKVITRVKMLSKFVKTNESHVAKHGECYASGQRVKFPTSRGFFVGLEDETGTIHTLVTPASEAIKYKGKALLLDTLASEIEFRINALSGTSPLRPSRVGFTGEMQEALAIAAAKAEASKMKRLNAAIVSK